MPARLLATWNDTRVKKGRIVKYRLVRLESGTLAIERCEMDMLDNERWSMVDSWHPTETDTVKQLLGQLAEDLVAKLEAAEKRATTVSNLSLGIPPNMRAPLFGDG